MVSYYQVPSLGLPCRGYDTALESMVVQADFNPLPFSEPEYLTIPTFHGLPKAFT